MEGAPDTWSAQAAPESGARAIEAPVRPAAAASAGARTPGAEAARPRDTEAASVAAVGVSAWQGSPSTRAYARRLILPAAAVGLGALAIGVTLMWLSFRGDAMFVYPLVGVLATALGVYGLLVRPVLVVRASRRVHYRIDRRGVEVHWSPEHKILMPADRVPPFSVWPARGSPAADVLFAGPPAWVGPWGAWRIVDDTWGLVGLERPDEAIAALEQLRAASPTPTAWAEGIVTVPEVRVFVPRLKHLVRRLAPWHAR